MAEEKLIFPIGFDLEEGVKKAGRDWKNHYRKRLQDAIDSRPLKVKIDFESKGIDTKEFKQWMALSREAEKLERERIKNAKERQKVADQAAMAETRRTNATNESNARIERANRKAEASEQRKRTAVERTNTAYKTQSTYLSRLFQRMVAYASIAQAFSFIRNIRDVTAEFELQRVALGSIIGDLNKANAMFAQIKAAAVKSPFQIKELVTYTKQLAAYKIETDELFETTQRLADISAGLGVGMERLVLAYGQIRATGYLRASEVRQLTEAGIPIVEELAKKMSQLRGETVSAAEAMDMISKRAISFDVVKEVFEDMTSAGGMFYKMQEKQAETLAGQWSNLQDSVAIMYEEIGNTAVINAVMKDIIQLLNNVMNHWTSLSSVVRLAATGFLVYKAALHATIPALGLYGKGVKGATLAEKAHEQLILRQTALFTKLTTAQLRQLANTKTLTQAEWERIIVEKKLNSASAIKLARMAKEDAALRKALISQKLYTAEQLRSIQAMNKWQYAWARTKAGFVGFGNALKPFLPIAALTLGIDLLIGWNSALKEKEEALKKVNGRYNEMRNSIENIASAFMELREASKSAVDSNALYGDKLKQLQEVVKLLSNYGLDKQIDISIVTPENIDSILASWINKLGKVNELSKVWGSQLSEIATQFDWMGIFGENLNEDMKDLTRTFTKITNNTDFSKALDQMRATISYMSQDNKELYESISKSIQGDATLALSQKKRNETELQYQQRIYKEYKKIYLEMQKMSAADLVRYRLPSFGAVDAQDMLDDFQADLNEVMQEINKTIGVLSDEEPLTIKMAIDEQFALNNWAEWQKEAVIQELNKDRLKIGLELIPYYSEDIEEGYSLTGAKSIMSTEFKGLITDADLEKMTSYGQIVDAIKTKYDDAVKRLKEAQRYYVEINNESEAYKKGIERIKALKEEIAKIEQLNNERAEISARLVSGNAQEGDISRQLEIERELSKLGASRLLAKQEEIKAITERNKMAKEGIEIEKKAADEEAKRAKEALDRLTTLNTSDIAKDVIGAFSQLKIDSIKVGIDPEYSKDFLISDDELEKIANIGDLYDIWAKNTKAIAEEQKKLAQTGISQITIEREKNRLAEQQKNLNAELAKVEQEITSLKYSGLWVQYQQLLEEKAIATTTEQIAAAEKKRAEFLGDVANAEFAILIQRKEGLESSLLLANQAQAAQQDNEAYLKSLEEAEKLYKEIAKRYNFRLFDKSGGGSREDAWIILMKNRMKFMQDFQKGVEDLSKFMGKTQGLSTEQENMLGRGLSLKIDTNELEGTKEELVKWYEDAIEQVRAKIGELGGKEWSGLGVQMILGKDTKNRVIKKYQELLQELFKELTDFRTDQIQKELEEKLKRLSDDLSRTKTAKEFFDKMLGMTGDKQLSTSLTVSTYGGEMGDDLGERLAKDMATKFQEQVQTYFGDIDISSAINKATGEIDPIKLEKLLTKENIDKIGKDNVIEIRKIINDLIKANADYAAELFKSYEKFFDYEKRMTMVTQREEEERKKIRESMIPDDQKEQLQKASKKREQEQISAIEIEQIKDTADWEKTFEDLNNLGSLTVKNLISLLEDYIAKKKKAGEPIAESDMKTLMNELNQLRERYAQLDPFATIKASLKDLTDATKEYNEAKKDKDEKKMANAQNKRAKALNKLETAVNAVASGFQNLSNLLTEFQELLGIEDDSAVGEVFNGAAKALGVVATALSAAIALTLLWNSTLWANPLFAGVAIVSGVLGAIAGVFSAISNAKVRRANKEIERQQKLLDQLAYSYERLEKAQDKVFGSDYISNYEKQIANLEAQQKAYLKQAEAERSKGKKADADKIQEYTEKARDAADSIADMRSNISEYFLGTDLTSAARDFANAWIDAYKEFESTTDAMKEKFQDMIQNMIVESFAAKVIQSALQPIFDSIDEMSKDGMLDMSEASKIADMTEVAVGNIDAGMSVVLKALSKAGISIRDMGTDLTGISRNIATASEESILGLAAGINTQNFYISQVPPKLDVIIGLLQGGSRIVGDGVNMQDLVTLQNQHLAYLPNIAQNTADTVARCERAALACERVADNLDRVIKPRGTQSAYTLNTSL